MSRPTLPSPTETGAAAVLPAPGPSPFVAMRPAHRRGLIAIHVIYGAVVLGVAWAAPESATSDFAVRLSLVLFLLMRIAPLVLFGHSYGWFHPFVLSALLGLEILVARFPMLTWGLEWHRALPDHSQTQLDHLVAYEYLLMSISLAAYYLGFWGARDLSAPKIPRTLLRRPAIFVTALVSLSTIGFLVYTATQGGIEAHVLSWGTGRGEAISGEHYGVFAYLPGVIGCLIWLAHEPDSIRNPLFWLLSAGMLTMVFVSSGGRGALVFYALIGTVIWMIRKRRIAPVYVALGAILALYLVTVLGRIRGSTREGELDIAEAMGPSVVDTINAGWTGEVSFRRTSASGTLPVLARVPSQVDLLYGSSYAALAVVAFPRAYWPEKPGLIGGRVGETFFGVRGGIPPGGIGEAYWNFHIPGVVLVFLIFGAFHRFAANLMLENRESAAATISYAITMILFRDPSTTAFVAMCVVLVPAAIVLAFTALRRASSARNVP